MKRGKKNDYEQRLPRTGGHGPIPRATFGRRPVAFTREFSTGQNHEEWLFHLVFLITFLCLLLFHGKAAAKPSSGAPTPAPAVTVAHITAKEVNPPAEFVGRIEAVQAVDLRARVRGYLKEARFQEGAYVHAGDLLYVIDQADYQARVAADEAAVAKARANLDKADKYLKRLQTVRSGGVSATDLENAESDVAQNRAALQEAEAMLSQSRINLGYTTITAPISGRIGKNAYAKGSLVGTNSEALARIVQVDPIRAVFSISENQLPEMQREALAKPAEELKKSRVIQLRLPNGEVYPRAGRPDFMDNEVDTSTGTIAFRAVFDNPDGYLVPGQYVTVLLSMTNPEKMPVVPQAAVLEDREGRYVFVVGPDNKVQQRRIETGETLGTEWAVESGLVVGETIVVQGIQQVRPGLEVRPMAAGQDKEGGASK